MLNLKTLQEIPVPNEHKRFVRHTSFSSDGTRLVTVGEKSEVKILKFETMQEIGPVPYQHRSSVLHSSFTTDSSRLVTVGHLSEVKMMHLQNLLEISVPYKHLTRDKKLTTVAAFLVSPDGSKIFTADSDGNLVIWFRDVKEARRWQ